MSCILALGECIGYMLLVLSINVQRKATWRRVRALALKPELKLHILALYFLAVQPWANPITCLIHSKGIKDLPHYLEMSHLEQDLETERIIIVREPG